MPDAKTVWLFREQLTRASAVDEVFAAFDAWLRGKGYLAMSGQIIDTSIIAAPRQRNTDAEKADLKEGLPARNIASACSCAPSASPAPEPRSSPPTYNLKRFPWIETRPVAA